MCDATEDPYSCVLAWPKIKNLIPSLLQKRRNLKIDAKHAFYFPLQSLLMSRAFPSPSQGEDR